MCGLSVSWQNTLEKLELVPAFRPLGVDWDLYTRSCLTVDTVRVCRLSLHQHLSLTSSTPSLSLSLKLQSLLRAVSFESRTPLYAPAPPTPSRWWFSAGCFHGNITFNCLRWALTFQFWWGAGWIWVSCFLFFQVEKLLRFLWRDSFFVCLSLGLRKLSKPALKP